jgi:hypothetical protein
MIQLNTTELQWKSKIIRKETDVVSFLHSLFGDFNQKEQL